MAQSRISLVRCREFLGEDAPSSESDLEELLNGLYSLADLALGLLQDQGQLGPISINDLEEPAEFSSCLQLIPSEDHEGLDERAAIREFEGDQQRDLAERSAVLDFLGKNSG